MLPAEVGRRMIWENRPGNWIWHWALPVLFRGVGIWKIIKSLVRCNVFWVIWILPSSRDRLIRYILSKKVNISSEYILKMLHEWNRFMLISWMESYNTRKPSSVLSLKKERGNTWTGWKLMLPWPNAIVMECQRLLLVHYCWLPSVRSRNRLLLLPESGRRNPIVWSPHFLPIWVMRFELRWMPSWGSLICWQRLMMRSRNSSSWELSKITISCYYN